MKRDGTAATDGRVVPGGIPDRGGHAGVDP